MAYTHESSVHFVKFDIGCAWYGAIYLLAVRIVLLQSPAITVVCNRNVPTRHFRRFSLLQASWAV